IIETLRDVKRGKDSYESLNLERTASQILHHMEVKDSEDSLESTRARMLTNARTICGPTRHLDTITYSSTSSRKVGAATIEHNPTGRSYIHCCSAKESSRLTAYEHLLVITEDLLQRLIDVEGISSSGWLPATPQTQHAANYGSGSVAGSVVGGGSLAPSRRSSVQPTEGLLHKPMLVRSGSDTASQSSPQSQLYHVPRTNSSDVIAAPKLIPAGRVGGHHAGARWYLGSEG
ncbi:hypothetical protein K469DRAFT_565156, partial [Zopfia rhizophila CBS 207.26]